MSATAPLPVTAPPVSAVPPAAATESRGAAGETSGRRFDDHLATARQRHDAPPDPSPHTDRAARDTHRTERGDAKAGNDPANGHAAATAASTPTPPATDPLAEAETAGSAAARPADGDTPTDPAATGAAVSVAGAMLALLGQAMPANASAATGGAAKVMAASVLKASLGGAPTDTATEPATSDADATATAAGTGATTAAPADAQGGRAAFADLFAAGMPKFSAHKSGDAGATQDLAALVAATPASTPNTGVAPPHALHLASPVGSPAFAQELGQQVAWLGNQDVKQAKIRLHPEELGQLDVKVSVQHGGQVDVTFAAQHPATVHALQQTLPQLDTLLAQHGLSLGQASVGQQQSGGDGRPGQGASGGHAADGVEGVAAAETPATVGALGLVDAFA